ncbi:MAG: hypothetical protein JSS65_13370 [Armatimonadetes bacterium]|nr:hypothetical protein [Armatimonadota bacterium]
MGFIFLLAVILIVLGLKQEELYGKEAAVFGALTLAFFIAYGLLPNARIMVIIPQAIVDLVLIFKLFGDNLSGR